MTTIAFIGLGNMGGPMAANLVKAGHRVQGFDVVEAAKVTATAAGIIVVDSIAEAATDAEVVITMLPNGAIVTSAQAEALTTAAPGTLFIDSSTIAVADVHSTNAALKAAGMRHVDAPVSGGITGAAAGTLAFMVGGEAADVEAARPYCEIMGRSFTHCGDLGAGQAVKVCNNMVLAVQQIAIGEAMVLGEKLGLSPQAFYDVVSNATGACWALNVNCPVPGPVPTSPANRDFQPGFATALMHKDLGLALQALEETGVDAQLGKAAAAQYSAFNDAGHGGLDFSAIITAIRDSSN